MSIKVKPTEYLDEDYLFLILQLLDYPKKERNEFTFSEIRAKKYKDTTVSKIFYYIKNLNDQGFLGFEEYKFYNNIDYKIIKALISMTVKFPEHELSLAIKRIMDDNFNSYDLEIILSYGCSDYIFDSIDFNIKINGKFKQKYADWLKKYLKLFADEKLESKTKNYFKVELQKENVKKKIDELSRKTGSSLVLKSSDFSDEQRFFESILLLDNERFLIIKNINSGKTKDNLFSYIIHCELKEKSDSRPFCKIKNGMGFLKFSKNGKDIKIGRTDSRHFKLLKFLLETSGTARTIDSVFEYIKTDKDKNDPIINDPYLKPAKQIQILENVKKELQKKDRMRGQIKIKIDKKKRTIRAEYRNEGN